MTYFEWINCEHHHNMLPFAKLDTYQNNTSKETPLALDFAGTYHHYRPHLILYLIHKRSLSLPEAEDIVQQAALKLAEKWDNLNLKQESVWLYLSRTVVSVHLNQIRDRNTQKRKCISVPFDQLPNEDGSVNLSPSHTVENQEPGPEKQLANQELKKAIYHAIQELPEKPKQVFILREIQGETFENIAKVLKITVSTARGHLHQAKKRLQQVLKPLND